MKFKFTKPSFANNRKNLVKDGTFWAMFDGLTRPFIIPFALALGATNLLVGVIGALSYMAALISQFPATKFVESLSQRKTFVFTVSVLAKAMWLPILIVPLFFKQNIILFFMLFLLLYWIFEWAAYPAWTSLAADIVPKKIRGNYFGKRNMIMGLAAMICTLIGGFYLDLFPKDNLSGFLSMFLVAVIFGLLSAYFIKKIKEPKFEPVKHNIKDFFHVGKDFKKLCRFIFYFNFGYLIASPFFAVYMLKNLEMSYSLFVLFILVSTLFKIISQKYWGIISDKIGDKPVALISVIGTSLVPLFFIFINKSNMFMLIPIFIIAGIAFGGFHLSSFNLLLDVTNKKHRIFDTAEYNMITSVPMIIAPILGGFIADNISFILVGIPLVFAIGFILRLSSALFLIPLKEPRVKKSAEFKSVLREMFSSHVHYHSQIKIRHMRHIK